MLQPLETGRKYHTVVSVPDEWLCDGSPPGNKLFKSPSCYLNLTKSIIWERNGRSLCDYLMKLEKLCYYHVKYYSILHYSDNREILHGNLGSPAVTSHLCFATDDELLV